MITIPTLETERLILRGWRESDEAPFAALCADADLMRFVGGKMDATEAFRRMAAYAGCWLLRGYGPFALEDKASGALAGYCGVYDPRGIWPEREINWGVARAFVGRGLATEAATRVRACAYDTLDFSTIASCIALENAASLKVAARLRATLERTVEFRGAPMGVFRHCPPGAQREAAKGAA